MERERESLHLPSHTGLMQVLPRHPLADTTTEWGRMAQQACITIYAESVTPFQ